MTLLITPSGQACGATVRGVDLTAALDDDTVASIRAAWLEHRVLGFPDQAMTDDNSSGTRFGLVHSVSIHSSRRSMVIRILQLLLELPTRQHPSLLTAGTLTGASRSFHPTGPACSPKLFRPSVATPNF
jgi:alpha-ketoglutarate-dependent taurine dioxygenase